MSLHKIIDRPLCLNLHHVANGLWEYCPEHTLNELSHATGTNTAFVHSDDFLLRQSVIAVVGREQLSL